MSGSFEQLDHTADLGLRARGETLEEAFRQAARGLFDAMVDLERVALDRRHAVSCTSRTVEGLLVEWLSDLLAQKDLSGLVFGEFELEIGPREDGFALSGSARGEPLAPGRHDPKAEVKGISYLGLRVEESADGWIAECVLDV